MIATRRWGYLLAAASVAAFIVAVGCRDDEPTPSHYRDLGEGSRALTPVAPVWHAVSYRSGDRADWVPFRELGAEPEPEETVPAGSQPEDEPANETSEAEAEVRELIKEYNELAADHDVDEMLLYHVESQREAIKPMFELAGTLAEKLDDLREALEEKLPDEHDRIAAVFEAVEAGSDSGLTVQTLTVVSPTEVTGTTPPGSPVPLYKFKYVDDEWSIEIPQLSNIAALKPALEAGMAQFDTLLQALSSGTVPAETILAQLEQGAKIAAAMKPAAKDDGEEDKAAKPEGDKPDEEGD